MKKGILGLGILSNKAFLIVAVPLLTWFGGNLWGPLSNMVTEKSYDALYQFIRQVILLIGGSQHLIFESVYSLQTATATNEILYFSQLVLGGMVVTFLIIVVVWKILKVTAAGSFQSWNVFAKGVMVIVVIGGVGLFGTFMTFLATGSLYFPYHGFIELGRFSAELGWGFTQWLLVGIS